MTGCQDCLELVAENFQDTRTPGTGATASTAAGRSPPPAPWNGGEWSGGRALTVDGQDGNDQQGPR